MIGKVVWFEINLTFMTMYTFEKNWRGMKFRMIEKLKRITNKKIFHLVMIIVIIFAILFVSGIIILRYNVEGETNMPFSLTKIILISQVDGTETQPVDVNNRWAFNILENNDIYLYIHKNSDYTEQETIKSVKIDNINLVKAPNIGVSKFYRPDVSQETAMFVNNKENECTSLEYVAESKSDIKNMKISNQGGIVAFRYGIQDIGTYEGNDQEVNYTELLKKASITEENLKANLQFDFTILLDSGKSFQTTITLDLPVDNIVEQGTTSQEITDVGQYIFKRVNIK